FRGGADPIQLVRLEIEAGRSITGSTENLLAKPIGDFSAIKALHRPPIKDRVQIHFHSPRPMLLLQHTFVVIATHGLQFCLRMCPFAPQLPLASAISPPQQQLGLKLKPAKVPVDYLSSTRSTACLRRISWTGRMVADAVAPVLQDASAQDRRNRFPGCCLFIHRAMIDANEIVFRAWIERFACRWRGWIPSGGSRQG